MKERIKGILLDLLKSFRWYLYLIPFVIAFIVLCSFKPMLSVALPFFLFPVIFFLSPVILFIGLIVCIALSIQEKKYKKEIRKLKHKHE